MPCWTRRWMKPPIRAKLDPTLGWMKTPTMPSVCVCSPHLCVGFLLLALHPPSASSASSSVASVVTSLTPLTLVLTLALLLALVVPVVAWRRVRARLRFVISGRSPIVIGTPERPSHLTLTPLTFTPLAFGPLLLHSSSLFITRLRGILRTFFSPGFYSFVYSPRLTVLTSHVWLSYYFN